MAFNPVRFDEAAPTPLSGVNPCGRSGPASVWGATSAAADFAAFAEVPSTLVSAVLRRGVMPLMDDMIGPFVLAKRYDRVVGLIEHGARPL